jgi:four helix bundle protein
LHQRAALSEPERDNASPFPSFFSVLFLKFLPMFPYQNLEVYKKAFNNNRKVYAYLKVQRTLPSYLKSQFGRSALSIMLNIAEGSGRLTSKDRKSFFVIARGSAFECASIAEFLRAEDEISEELKTELVAGFEEVSKILFVMIRNLGETKEKEKQRPQR